MARYLDVRENSFAFEPAYQGPDYLRVQMEKARDFSNLRNANQLLQSEGFYASFFFLWVIRGNSVPAEKEIGERERHIMLAMRTMFSEDDWDPASPWLVQFVTAYMKEFPEQKAAMVDALNDLSHGVFVDPGAARLWKAHYLAALSLDKEMMNIAGITEQRRQWHAAVRTDPHVLFSQLGPELPCKLKGIKVRLNAFGEDSQVLFDVNTAPAGILRLVPGITETDVAAWIEQRGQKPFASIEDFKSRGGQRAVILAALEFQIGSIP